MRLLVVGSGHAHSTFDIGKYYADGFEKAGVETKLLRYDSETRFAIDTVMAIYKSDDPNKHVGDAIYLASRAVMAEIAIFRPDAVVFVTGTNLFPDTFEWLARYRSILKGPLKSAIILTESPYIIEDELAVAHQVDAVFTNDRSMLAWLRHVNRASFYLRQAYSDSIHRYEPAEKKLGVFFCGSGHIRRLKMISMADWTGVDLTLMGHFPTLKTLAPHLSPFYSEGLVNNTELASLYRQSKVCLNVHRLTGQKMIMYIRDGNQFFFKEKPSLAQGAYSVNNRTMEVAACGSFQLCDDQRPELEEIFGDSVATYSSAEELSDKAKYYLSHEDSREDMARESLRRVQGMTYTNNARRVLEILDKV